MPKFAAALQCCLPVHRWSPAPPDPGQAPVARNLHDVANASNAHPALPTANETRTFTIPREVLRREARVSTDGAIDRIASMVRSREAIPLEQWQSAFDMLAACLDLFRDPGGMGLPARERAVFEALFVRPVAAGTPLRGIAESLKRGTPVFEAHATRAELVDFLRDVQRAFGRDPTIEPLPGPLEMRRQAEWERCSEATGSVARLVLQDDVTVEQWRVAIGELIECLERLRDGTADGMGMRDGERRQFEILDTRPAMNGLPLRRVPGHLHELRQPAGRATLGEFAYWLATALANHAIASDDMDGLDVLHANRAFPDDARMAVGLPGPTPVKQAVLMPGMYSTRPAW